MLEKVNKHHPDKVADRIAGAIVDYAYALDSNPKIAVEVLVGHGRATVIAESSVVLPDDNVNDIVQRFVDVAPWDIDFIQVPQDAHLAENQLDCVRCGDNGVFTAKWNADYEKAIGQLVGYVNNARTHSKEQILQLRSSLREFGFVSPCLITSDYSVLAGHGRIEAAKAEGYETVPCVFVEGLSEAQRKAYILADNRLALNAGWDEALLSIELADLQGADFDISLLGFDGKELEKLLAEEKEAGEDTFDVDAELEKPVFSKTGDIWTLGSHRLICGDSTKPETYAALMQGKQANLIVTDPPYGIDYDKGAAGKIKNDKFDSDDAFYTFLLDAFTHMGAALASDGAAYVFHADSKGLVFRRAFDDAGFKLSGCCIWAKNTFTLGRSDYQWCHEPCLYGWKKTGKHNWYGDRKQSTIWHCDKPSRSEKHPTMKPIPLLAVPIQNSTQTNAIVLEPFAGSGSTLICCEQLGRACYAIELDEKFVDVIVNRYIESVGTTDGVSVERDGKTLKYEEVTAQ